MRVCKILQFLPLVHTEFLENSRTLNSLTKKDAAFVWSSNYKKVFQKLKQRACKALILKHFNPNKQYFVETDFSDYINADVLSEQGEDGLLHPLSVPEKLWVDVTIDFVTSLLKCHAYSQIYNAIFIVIDCLLKKCYYIPCTEENEDMSAEATAELFMRHV